MRERERERERVIPIQIKCFCHLSVFVSTEERVSTYQYIKGNKLWIITIYEYNYDHKHGGVSSSILDYRHCC